MTSLCIPDTAQRGDLLAFVDRVLRLDDAAVIRLRARADGFVGAWASTGFDVLAVRVVAADLDSRDITCSAQILRRGLQSPDESGRCDVGYSMDSAWRTALPPETGFIHLDDVPASALIDLTRQGAELAREYAGPQGPPVSLLDQGVLEVSSGNVSVAVPMRCVMALAAMGFMSDADGEVVRVRFHPAWLRIDARFGSVFRRRGDPPLLLN
jgi:hypothetical protein